METCSCFEDVSSAVRLLQPYESDSTETTQTAASNGNSKEYSTLQPDRIEALVDMVRDVTVYVESKDFELGLPITNFARYHELYEMNHYGDYEEEE